MKKLKFKKVNNKNMRKYTAKYLTDLGMNKEFLQIKEMGKITIDAKTAILNSIFPNGHRKLVEKHQNGKYISNR